MFTTDADRRNFFRHANGAGDVDGDGLDDLLLFNAYDDTYGSYAGVVYLLRGAAGGY